MSEVAPWAAAAAAVRARVALAPHVAIVAGSGLDGLAERLSDAHHLPYDAIPGWPAATAPGHRGALAVGRLGGIPTAIARGRAHLYEGHAPADLAFGVRVLHALGARTLVVTNAAGGLDPALAPGAVVVLADHLFLPGLAGASPLRGANDDALGPRFPGLVGAYDPALRRLALDLAPAAGLSAREGIYAMVAGPAFETPAEARMLRLLGADVVGMSTAPEVVAARHLGMRCLGLSLVANRVALTGPPAAPAAPRLAGAGAEDMAAEVLDAAAAAAPRLAAWIEAVVAALPDAASEGKGGAWDGPVERT